MADPHRSDIVAHGARIHAVDPARPWGSTSDTRVELAMVAGEVPIRRF